MNNAESSAIMKRLLKLKYSPIAVKLFKPNEAIPSDIRLVEKKSRYCQLLMLAMHGETYLLTPEKLACPAAYAAFGFGPLPEKVACGQMQKALGLYQTKEAAANTMATMPRLKPNSVSAIAAAPLEDFPYEPDIVVVEGLPEQIMWLCLARTHERGGRLNFSSSIFQCCCVDVTVVPYKTKEVNISPGCYGTREATDVPAEHMFMGIPFQHIEQIVSGLIGLSEKAIINARKKGVYYFYSKQELTELTKEARFEGIRKKYQSAKHKRNETDLLPLKFEIESFLMDLKNTASEREDLLAETQEMLIELVQLIEQNRCHPLRSRKL